VVRGVVVVVVQVVGEEVGGREEEWKN